MTVLDLRLRQFTLLLAVAGSCWIMYELCRETVLDARRAVACFQCHSSPLTAKERQLAERYIKQGAPDPVRMARAVAHKKHGTLLAKISIVESGGDHRAVGKAGERGAFQVRPELWGDVPLYPDQQADQAEQILEAYLRYRGGVFAALSGYNGDRTGRYARKVLGVKL